MYARIIPGFVLALSLALPACGSDINDADPRVIPGGGIGDGAINGRVNVTIIDADTEEPISGATVLLGEPGETPLDGTTDSAGLITFDDPALKGPTTITTTASGYAAATWFGANGANVTIPLSPRGGGAPQVPSATLSGTVDGWNDIPIPPADHVYLALVNYSQSTELGDAVNELPQNGNTCFKIPVIGGECNWTLNARTGAIAVYAILADVDTKGNADESDDTIEIIGFAYNLDVTVQDGVDQSGLVLTQLEPGTMEDVMVTIPTPPSGMQAAGILALDIGERGLLMAGIVDPDTSDMTRVPSAIGPFEGASYRGFAFASEEVQTGGASSATLLRGITDLSAGVEFGPWLGLPTNIMYAGGEYSFTGSPEATLHIVDLRDPNGETLWAIGLLDGRQSFTLPGLEPNPLPAGQVVMEVTALDGVIDLKDFSLDELLELIDRTSANQITFAN